MKVFRQIKQSLPHIRRGVLIGGLLLLLVAGGWWLWQWHNGLPHVQMERLNAARLRWQARPFEHYRLEIAQDSQVLTHTRLEERYEVWDESLNMTQSTIQLMSVSRMFDWIERYPRHDAFRCGGLNFECLPPTSYRVQATYDPQLGYPRRIELIRTRQPDWFNPEFWRWLVTSGEWITCDHPLCMSTTRTTIEITDLTPVDRFESDDATEAYE
jgi:hypothetical protein